jgi:prepilin-type N-terminal cleavage/methylation domain-containing protein
MHKKINGFSLLEVLISILVFSIALLGLNAMDVLFLSEQRKVYHLSLAIQQIQNIEERLLALRDQAGLDEQVQGWNLQNQMLLPSSKGEVLVQYPHYYISLKWGNSNCKDNDEVTSGCIKEEFNLQ